MIVEIVTEGLDMGDVIVAALKSQMAWEKDERYVADFIINRGFQARNSF